MGAAGVAGLVSSVKLSLVQVTKSSPPVNSWAGATSSGRGHSVSSLSGYPLKLVWVLILWL